LDGNIKEEIEAAYEAVGEICIQHGAIDVLVADTREAEEKIWEGRSCIIDAAKAEGVIEVLDAVVPRDKVPDLIDGLEVISKKYGIASQNFGHAGDGNVHTNLLKLDMNDEEWRAVLPQVIEEVYELSVSLGGKISGEHGTGIIRKKFLPMALSHDHIQLMKGIKKVFDPNNIINPGKIFDIT
jgi:glycolate oxidase